MIQETLEALEIQRQRVVVQGLNEAAELIWSQTGDELLLAIGGWQQTLADTGVHPGDRVGVDLPRGPELLASHLAILAMGACVVPLNPALSARERERLLERATLRTLLDSSSQRAGAAKPRLRPAPSEEAPALLIFTSGTTGDPKGVPHTLSGLRANLAGLQQIWALAQGERILHILPAHHVHGLVLGLYGCARAGMQILLAPRFQTDSSLVALERHGVNVCMAVPTMLHRLSRVERVPDLPHLRLFTSGSAPLSENDFRLFAERFGMPPVERYGLTETLIVSSNPLNADRIPGTVGLPLPDTEIRLAEDGEILVKSPSVLVGYWGDLATTREVMRDGYFCTGDLGRFDPSGHLVISGRKKELIIVGGSNVLPGEIEAALCDEAGVEELAAVGLPDPDRGECVAVFIVLSSGASAESVEHRVRSCAEERLARYKRPRAYRFVAELPRNSMGKIDRRALRSLVS